MLDLTLYNEMEHKLLMNILKHKFKIRNYLSSYNFLRINNFFTNDVAEYIYNTIKESEWIRTEGSQEKGLEFSFEFAKRNEKLENIYILIGQLYPEYLKEISSAKYTQRDGIKEHTDEQGYVMEGGIKYYRKMAMIFYFNKSYNIKNGGLFQDLENGVNYLPTFNSCVMFNIPFKHAVTPIIKGERLSLFGWFADEYDNQYYLPDDRFSRNINLLK